MGWKSGRTVRLVGVLFVGRVLPMWDSDASYRYKSSMNLSLRPAIALGQILQSYRKVPPS